jgi:hypothetical protein
VRTEAKGSAEGSVAKTGSSVRRGEGKRSLCGQPEQLVDHTILCEDISPGEPMMLAFAEPVHGFIALDGPLRGVERPKP